MNFFDKVKEKINTIGKKNYEPKIIAETLSKLNLRYAVITSVDRDDLIDGGAEHWVKTIQNIRIQCPEIKIETLIPDFKGDKSLLKNRQLVHQENCLINRTIEKLYLGLSIV